MPALSVVRFCARECELQMSGERSVAWMVEAWMHARAGAVRKPTVNDVLVLGSLVEPFKNVKGFRTCGVRVGWDVKMDWKYVPGQMVNLMEGQDALTPAEFFYEYEQVHPFVDGNGRTGLLLFLWLSGKLDDLDWAPNFWNDPRRLPGDGAPREL